LVESVADQSQSAGIAPAHHSSVQPTYIGIDGTFINAQPVNRFLEAKAAIIFTNQRMTVSQRRNVLLNKRYVGRCLSVSEWSRKLFSCAHKMGVADQSQLIILADGARWISQLAQRQYPSAKLILDWWQLKKQPWQTVDWLKRHGLWSKDGVTGRDKSVIGYDGEKLVPPYNPVLAWANSSLQSFYLDLKNNLDSVVDYHSYRKKGCYISSILVEKAIDLLVSCRLKFSLWAQKENQTPVVTNPIARQLDYERVLISYQVEDGDGDLMTVSVKVSDDGGRRFGFIVPLEQLSGDVGEGKR